MVLVLGVLLLIAAGIGIVVVVGVVAAALVASGPRTARSPAGGGVVARDAPAAYLRARRHASLAAGASWAVAGAIGVGVGSLASLGGSIAGSAPGLGIALLPAAVGLTFLAIAAVGELTWPRPKGAVRSAPLVPRTVGRLAPRGLRRLTWAWTVGLVLTLVVTGLTAGPTGRAVQVTFPDHGASAGAGAGPYPGTPYGVPLALAGLLVLAAAEGVLRLVARRPAVVDTDSVDDERLRRVSSRRALAGAQLVLAGTLGAVLLVAGNALRGAASITYGWSDGAQTVMTTATVPWVLVAGILATVVGLAVAATGLVVTVAALGAAATEAGLPTAEVAAP